MTVIGIDIGTTTICGMLYDVEGRRVLSELTLPDMEPEALTGAQDPEFIYSQVVRLLEGLRRKDTAAAGFSSQMHGILYLDSEGRALSPFYSWQNQEGKALEEEISERLGFRVYTGYGLVTHKALGAVPEGASVFCNIGDYVAMRLSGRKEPLSDTSIAASLGIWDGEVTEAFPEDSRYFPAVTAEAEAIGEWNGITVTTALGDNQCSFLGSVTDLDSDIVLSYGTSGQLSFYSAGNERLPGFERRPLGKDGFMQVAFSLAGGESFRLLSRFFEEVLEMAGAVSERPMYEILDSLRLEDEGISCKPFFLGERGKPGSSAVFSGITRENFRPEAFTYALLDGMAWELWRFYDSLPEETKREKARLVGTGNGILRNPGLQRLLKERYGMPLVPGRGGSTLGAVMNALVAIGHYPDYRTSVKEFNNTCR